ncbi:MAG TPA: peptidoglycan DD-metalloendopeptidase family protein [Gemmatimonadaceae bacterium]|nr:peptidoglycan DD-metalloendopeptidase family protein [Gemmatimonadaceae bacterium]
MSRLTAVAVHAALAIVALGATTRALSPAAGSARPLSAAAAIPRLATLADGAIEETEPSLAGPLLVPVAGVLPRALRDAYTERRSGGRVHEAIDIMAPRGTPVVAAADGKLLKLHRSRLGGLMVYAADAADRLIFMYAHLDRYAPDLKPGAPIRRGQLLGYVGTTGNAPRNAPHLHFAIARGKPSVKWWKGTAVNPYPLLTRAGSLEVASVEGVEPAPTSAPRLATRRPTGKRASVKQVTVKRAAAKRVATKRVATKRVATKRVTTQRVATKRAAVKRNAATRAAIKRSSAKRASATSTRRARAKATAS